MRYNEALIKASKGIRIRMAITGITDNPQMKKSVLSIFIKHLDHDNPGLRTSTLIAKVSACILSAAKHRHSV